MNGIGQVTFAGADVERITLNLSGGNDTVTLAELSVPGGVALQGGLGDDTLNVTPSLTSVIAVAGGDPAAPASPGDALTVFAPAGQISLDVPIVGTGSGKFTASGGYQDVNYTGIETALASNPNQPPVNT